VRLAARAFRADEIRSDQFLLAIPILGNPDDLEMVRVRFGNRAVRARARGVVLDNLFYTDACAFAPPSFAHCASAA
jgi:hypothetical protein